MPQFQTFKDLSNTFKLHPVTGDLIVKKDAEAIKQAIINLLSTVKGERFFNFSLGSELRNLLFEPLDDATASSIQREVITVIQNYEPRVRLLEITVDSNYEYNGFDVGIQYEIVGREDRPAELSFFLESNR
jgi:phage baseplate assembly protein W